MSKKVYFKALLIIFILAFITVVSVFYLKVKNGAINDQAINEVSQLKNDNQGVIAMAQGAGLKSLRKIDSTDYVWGDAEAPVEIIIYSDFESPFSLKLASTLSQIQKEFADQVKIAFRHYALGMYPEEMKTANAVECAGEQEKFWEMVDRLFIDNQDNNLDTAQYQVDAHILGLKIDQFNSCLAEEKYKEKVQVQTAEGKSFGVNGTPTIFVNNNIFPGAVPFKDYQASDGTKQLGMESVIKKQLNNLDASNPEGAADKQ